MMHESRTPEAIFGEAIEIVSPKGRADFLKVECGDDAGLFRMVEKLVADHFRAGSFLAESPVQADVTLVRPVTDAPSDTIGPYKLLQHIGEGGMGAVYMAEQTHPVQRKVALKVIKPGMDSRQVIARFEAERQALAIMDHVNIARVLDAGTTGGEPGGVSPGRPYFVMELVHGVPITKYCDDNQLTPRERLELFVPVCQAIQHAHQKGIIHRDIKPSNVMVTLYDGKPVPKVIDFGVAKAIEQPLTERTLFTQYGTLVGTLEYTSPEQAEMSALGVDTRSDIYSLGVLLYELLTGSTPLTHKRIREAAYGEIIRMIKEEEAPRPSTRLSDSGEALASISAQRHMEPAKLTKLMRGELDWIVMKCLEKDRNRRYETASAFAADVQRYLSDEPVQACPPSTWYRFRKLAVRNKGLFAVATASLLVVLLGVVTLAVSNSMIRQEQARTKEEKDRVEQQRLLAEDRADEIRQGLDRLKAANSWLERGRWYVAMQQWDDAHIALTKAVELRPDHAEAWVERGDFFAQLGLWDLASADFAREFELRKPDTTMRWFRHALLRLSSGDVDGYRQVRQQMRERFQRTSDQFFALEVVRTCVLGSEPEEDLEELVDVAQHVADAKPGSWYELYVLGVAHYRAGHHEQAAQRLRESLAAAPEWWGREISYPVLAMADHHRGETAEARQSLQRAADAIDRWTRERYEHPGERVWAVNQGAGAVWPIPWWDWVECQLYYREAKLMIDGSPPADDPRLHVLHARALAGMRRNFTADVEYAAILQGWPDNPQFRLEAHRCAAYSAVARAEWTKAANEFTRASELAPDDVRLAEFRALALLGAGDVGGYREAGGALLERYERTTEPRVAGDVVLACVLRDDAVPDMPRLLPLARVAATLYNDGPRVLGAALYRSRRCEESIRCFEAAANVYHPRAWDWSFLAMNHHRLGHADEARGCLAEARRWIDEANKQTDQDLTGTRPVWGSWYDPFVYSLLFREAEELLNAELTIRDQKPEP